MIAEFETRTIKTESLNIEYFEIGPSNGQVVILLHGWPDSAHTWKHVAPSIAASGYHVIMPFLRGFGGTTFLHETQARSGQLTSLGKDVIELADALNIEKFSIVGHDWGARAAYIATCIWPERIVACTAISVGWGTNSKEQTLQLQQIQNYWYQWYLSCERGAVLIKRERNEFTQHIWNEWCPYWKISTNDLIETQGAFANTDWAEIVLHSYRHRWGWALSDPKYEELENILSNAPKIKKPTLVIHGAQDPCNSPSTSANKEVHFAAAYKRELIDYCGHFPQREHPDVVAKLIVSWFKKYDT
jgi:pimeloyl-ACP methyl ester carboxylesterase